MKVGVFYSCSGSKPPSLCSHMCTHGCGFSLSTCGGDQRKILDFKCIGVGLYFFVCEYSSHTSISINDFTSKLVLSVSCVFASISTSTQGVICRMSRRSRIGGNNN
jgi:hypothetical protein